MRTIAEYSRAFWILALGRGRSLSVLANQLSLISEFPAQWEKLAQNISWRTHEEDIGAVLWPSHAQSRTHVHTVLANLAASHPQSCSACWKHVHSTQQPEVQWQRRTELTQQTGARFRPFPLFCVPMAAETTCIAAVATSLGHYWLYLHFCQEQRLLNTQNQWKRCVDGKLTGASGCKHNRPSIQLSRPCEHQPASVNSPDWQSRPEKIRIRIVFSSACLPTLSHITQILFYAKSLT